MGYTHYWSQRRNFTKAEWEQATADIRAILDNAEQRWEIPLANGNGDSASRPEFYPAYLAFNGRGEEDSHETFYLAFTRPKKEPYQDEAGGGFCKTANKPYDTAVTAVLCYLSNFHKMGELDEERTPVVTVSSDGRGRDFQKGLELARQALPHLDNVLDLPLGVMEYDRWVAPWLHMTTKAYEFRFCVDGYAYVFRLKDGATFRFHTHKDAAEWAESFRERHCYVSGSWSRGREGGGSLFDHSGSYDQARHRSIARQQASALKWLFDYHWTDTAKARGELGHQPPAFVRPGDMLPELEQPNRYYLRDLLKGKEAA